MRKVFGIILSMIMMLQVNIGNKNEQDIDVLIDTMDELDIEVASWEVTHIVNISTYEIESLLSYLESDYLIVKEVTDETTIYTAQPRQQIDTITEDIRIVDYASNSTFQMTLSADVWNDHVRKYYKMLTKDLQSHMKLQNMQTYTCIRTGYSDTINKDLFNEYILDELKIEYKSEQADTIQNSTYEKEIIGYTPLFQHEINVNNIAVNMQMMIKNTKNNKKQLIIGTPIILNEY